MPLNCFCIELNRISKVFVKKYSKGYILFIVIDILIFTICFCLLIPVLIYALEFIGQSKNQTI